MTDRHIGFRVSEALYDALEEVAAEARTSKSEVGRHYLSEAVLESSTEIPQYLREELERERRKRRNRLTWQRIHFPSNVADRFTRAFEQGDLDGEINPGAIEELREIYLEEAEGLFHDPDRKEAAVEFVEALADHAEQAQDATEFDRLDPEEMFEHYQGVERGRRREEVREEIDVEMVERARTLMSPSRTVGPGGAGKSDSLDPEETIERLMSLFDLDEFEARAAVDRAADQIDGGAAADD